MPALPLETVHPLRACRLELPGKIPLQGMPPYFRELGRDRLLPGTPLTARRPESARSPERGHDDKRRGREGTYQQEHFPEIPAHAAPVHEKCQQKAGSFGESGDRRDLQGKKRKDTKKKGISRQKEGMAIGTDSSGKVVKAGHPTLKSLRRAWKGRIKEESTVVHDSLHGYKGLFSPSDGRTEVWVKSKVPEQETMLSDLNKACSGLKWFLRKHRGIKKRYLKYYLAWYEFVQNFSPTNTEFEELVFGKYLQKQLTTLN